MRIHSDVRNHGRCCHPLRETADVVVLGGAAAIITIVRHQLVRRLADRRDGDDDEDTFVPKGEKE